MKRIAIFRNLLLASILSLLAQMTVSAQSSSSNDIQNWRPYGQRGVNLFEAPKTEPVSQDEGIKVRIGGNFTQQFQSLTHENNATAKWVKSSPTDSVNVNKLYDIAPGFNLATANLNIDVQLAPGIRVALENYMSARRHSEFWVKGGYIQVDQLPMFGNPEWFSKYVTVKFGHMEVNYGDQHFRRTDNGNAAWNPFVGNYIMDAFATEIGGEVYFRHPSGFMAMAGMTAGLINGDVKNPNPKDLDVNPGLDHNLGLKRSPSLLLKLAYDKTFNDDLRFRLSGSMYTNANTIRNTLYAGDRTGSRFYYAMEPEYYVSGGVVTATTAANRPTSGRQDPGFTNKITSIQINPFVKFKGLEFFGTYETSTGQAKAERADRTFNQIAAELIYRFLPREQVYIGGRYNTISGPLALGTANVDVSINRIEVVAGWYVTRNLLVKAEYISQQYVDFPNNDYRAEGKFGGAVIEAVVAF